MPTPALPRRLVAEAIGTALLAFFAAGAVVAALNVGAEDYAGLGMIALATAFGIAVAVYAFAATSGAHLNPAVTIGLAVVRRFPLAEAAPYVVAQLVGGIGGAFLLVAIFGETEAVDNAAVGLTFVSDGTSQVQALVAEAVATFVLVLAVMSLAVDRRAAAGFAGLMIGLAIGAGILLIGPLTGGSLNPARTLGPLIASGVFDGDTNWDDLWVYVVGPVAGGALAALVYVFVARPDDAEAGPREVPGRQPEPPSRQP
jgi:glycerol uptake facilitator protein